MTLSIFSLMTMLGTTAGSFLTTDTDRTLTFQDLEQGVTITFTSGVSGYGIAYQLGEKPLLSVEGFNMDEALAMAKDKLNQLYPEELDLDV